MNSSTFVDNRLPTILIVQNSNVKLGLNSSILTLFNTVYINKSDNINLLAWVQQNQPDLIILEIEYPEESSLNLITPLKLDWLTRDIPVIIVGNELAICSANNLDYDASLTTPIWIKDLEQIICSLVNIPTCQTYAY